MPPREPRRKRLTPASVALGLGAVGCFALAIGLWAASAVSQQRTASLSPIHGLLQEAGETQDEADGSAGQPSADESGSDDGEPDPWEGAEERYPGLVAWVEVEGMGISTPVMASSAEAPDWFLDHDAFGNESGSGLPYLDYRCTPDGALRVVYAHNLGWGASEGFGALADAWQREVFDGIGTARWADLARTSPDGEDGGSGAVDPDGTYGQVIEFHPICAMKLAADETDLFRFDLKSVDGADWLDTVTPRADAISSGGIAGGAMSDHYLALVTCSGDGHPSQSRTLVLFGDGDEVYFDSYGGLLDLIEAMSEKVDGSGSGSESEPESR